MVRRALPIRNLTLYVRMALYAVIAGLVPERGWTRALAIIHGPETAAKRRGVEAALGPLVDAYLGARGNPEGLDRAEWLARTLLVERKTSLSVFSEHWPWRRNVRLAAHGLDHLRDALARGKGAILWVAHARHQLAWKKALWQAGIHVLHLSRPEHGRSVHRSAADHLNWILTRAEERYVERLVIAPGGEAPAVRRLHAALAANRVVSMQDSGSGRALEVPFLGGLRPFLVGAPTIALSSGAALLPALPFRERNGALGVTLGPAITPPPGLSRRAAVESMTREYARQVGAHIVVDPEFWSPAYWLAQHFPETRERGLT